jgi:enoyl-CoA hydratase/carnithine racemase
MLTPSHDFRVMRADRGCWCLPEVDIEIPFTPGMSALIQARPAPQTAHTAMTTGRRYGGAEAVAAGIVDTAVDEDAVRSTAVELAAAHAGKAGDILGNHQGADARTGPARPARPDRPAQLNRRPEPHAPAPPDPADVATTATRGPR